MSAQPLEIHVIADSTGETAARLARAAQAQFPRHPFVIVRHPRIANAESLYMALDSIRNHERPAAVFSTLVNSVLRDLVDDACNDMGIVHCDLLGSTLARLEVAAGAPAERVPMRPVAVEADYFTRIAAMEFAVRHDDGQLPSGLVDAEIVLIGPSRSGKTPLSMYLGYLGYRTANVPLVAGIAIPQELYRVDRWRLIGLTIDPQRLAVLRDKRVRGMSHGSGVFNPQDGYADLSQIYAELDEISAVQRKLGARMLDTTNIALEESASRVIDIVESRARMAGTRLRQHTGHQLTVTP